MVKSFAEAGPTLGLVGNRSLPLLFLRENIYTMAKELAKGIEAHGRSKSYHRR